MRTLYLVRHGFAQEYSVTSSDSARRLTTTGKTEIEHLGKHLNGLHIHPDLLISSPYIRACETATILASSLGYTNDVQTDRRLTPVNRYEQVCDLLFENTEFEEVMLVGHEPCMGLVVSGICADGLRLSFRQGSTCCIEIEQMRPVRGTMLWCISPDDLS